MISQIKQIKIFMCGEVYSSEDKTFLFLQMKEQKQKRKRKSQREKSLVKL